ncbi:hypothetical protein ABT299_44855 [Spirillospora sp. NPDC000708]
MTADERPDSEEGEERSDEMTATVAEGQAEKIVQFGGRIPQSLRRRARMCAASEEIDAQTLLRRALEEYLSKRDF